MKNMKKGQAIAWLVALVVILALMCSYAGVVIAGTFQNNENSLKLGLDLAGGVSITYEVVGDDPSDEDMADTIYKLQQRIENDLGEEASTTEASVYQVGTDRITVEIPGVSDANALLEELGTPGNLYFIAQTDADGNTNYSYAYNEETGEYEYQLNYTIEELEENGSIVLTGADVKSAQAGYQTDSTTKNQSPIVEISLTDEGAEKFATATETAYNNGESIGIYYDGRFVSVPSVNAVISDGNCIIEGMDDYEEASNLASYIRIGGLNLELQEIQSEVVGAQLGSDALTTSLIAGGIGIVLVAIFLIIMYLVPGAVASFALVLYTAIIIAILSMFEITLTLPGIAGIILSIGMAVDANVIIFARIREEIAAGKQVASAIDVGFKKAMSAILDGNITTLIAAAVLGVLGSGTVKGFAITLAIGVLLSMFTALVITRIIMKALFALGLRDAKFYGRAKDLKNVEFIGKKAFFFGGSLAVICAGFVFMAIHGISGDKALNYSLEFMGGTSTSVSFNEAYTLEEAEEQIVPVISEVTGDNDIQIQTVQGSNELIFKTRSLDLDERQALNTALEENFGVEESAISSENISSTISSEMRSESVIAVLVAVLFMLLYIWFRFKDLRYASSAIIALVHDVLVVLALYAIVRISVGSAFIACMLTVIGYSVNDTIVIFDRLRENMAGMTKYDKDSLKEVANRSITQSLSRSISTSITTAITVLMLLILGGSTIREFALPLLAGVICGTYSSICIATELWYLMKVYIHKKETAPAKAAQTSSKSKNKKK